MERGLNAHLNLGKNVPLHKTMYIRPPKSITLCICMMPSS